MNVKINIKTLNTMIAGMLQTRRVEEAKDLFCLYLEKWAGAFCCDLQYNDDKSYKRRIGGGG
jgi:pentatricopeptide repeat protein